MPDPGSAPDRLCLHLDTEAATEALARRLGSGLRPGDTLLLSGQIGTGKTFFARALIQHLLAATGRVEDVPSPSFTLVQTYELADCELWHVDLYRLSGPDELDDLGLEDAFEHAICLVEWPNRLGDLRPPDALELIFKVTGQSSRQLSVIFPARSVHRRALRAAFA